MSQNRQQLNTKLNINTHKKQCCGFILDQKEKIPRKFKIRINISRLLHLHQVTSSVDVASENKMSME